MRVVTSLDDGIVGVVGRSSDTESKSKQFMVVLVGRISGEFLACIFGLICTSSQQLFRRDQQQCKIKLGSLILVRRDGKIKIVRLLLLVRFTTCTTFLPSTTFFFVTKSPLSTQIYPST